MPVRVSLISKMFSVELEEAEHDILGLLDYYAQRRQKDEITPYVWMENRALLEKEISCVKELEKDIALWNPPGELTGFEFLDALVSFLKELVHERGYPDLVNLVVDRIAKKISRYME